MNRSARLDLKLRKEMQIELKRLQSGDRADLCLSSRTTRKKR